MSEATSRGGGHLYATGMMWGEGPRWHDGALWLSDTQGARLWTNASGSWGFTELESPSNGLAFLPDGRLVAAMMLDRRIGVWNGHSFDTYADLSAARGPLGDLTIDAAGNLYVDDVGYSRHLGEEARPGRILRVAAGGEVTTAVDGVEFPNGLAFIDGGRTLIVAETWKQRLRAFSVAAEGYLEDPRLYADLASQVGPDATPDGIWPAADRGVWVACLTAHRVVQIDDGRIIRGIETGSGLPIACCLGGRSQLFVTIADTGGRDLPDAIATRAVSTSVVAYHL